MAKAIASSGKIAIVYSDLWRRLMERLGEVRIVRASDVEWNGREWTATLRRTGEIIAHGPDRDEVIAAEVAWIEARELGGE